MRQDRSVAASCIQALYRGEESDEAEAAAMRVDYVLDLVEAFVLAHRGNK